MTTSVSPVIDDAQIAVNAVALLTEADTVFQVGCLGADRFCVALVGREEGQ